MFFKIGVLTNFANFTGKHLYWILFLIKKETPTQVLSCEVSEIFNTFFQNIFLQSLLLVFWKSGENFSPRQLTNSTLAVNNFTENFTADVSLGIFRNNIHSCLCCFNGLLEIFQWTQTSLKRHQDVLKRSRRLATKQDVVTTSGKRCRIYNVLKTSDLRPLEDVQFRTSWRRLISDVLRTLDFWRLEDVRPKSSWRHPI